METARAIWRRTGTWLVLGPFAILLAFPFYWMLTTMFKEDLDLNNASPNHVPYVYNPVRWEFWKSATTKHVTFLFEHTDYPRWLSGSSSSTSSRRPSSSCRSRA